MPGGEIGARTMPTEFMKAYLGATVEQRKAAFEALRIPSRREGGKLDADVRLVTYTEAAKRLNVSRPTVYRLARAGRLEVVPLDGVNRIRLKSVIDFANGMSH